MTPFNLLCEVDTFKHNDANKVVGDFSFILRPWYRYDDKFNLRYTTCTLGVHLASDQSQLACFGDDD